MLISIANGVDGQQYEKERKMSRAIKFRAWDKEKSRWVREYDYQLEKQGDPAYKKEYGEDSGWLDGEVASDLDLVNDRLTIDRYIWEQYTGLKDKNGKEIYEGDIVTDALGNKHTVEWDDEEVRYYFQPVGSTYYYDRVAPETTDYSTMEGRWSVIGNIHENPELL